MSIDLDKVRHIAKLARIAISEAEAEKMKGELNSILDWVEQLNDVDTDGVTPMTSAVETTLYQRPDEVTEGGKAEAVLRNAPDAQDGFFTVPKVVE